MCIGVGGCGCPRSMSINLMIFASFAFQNKAPTSASEADDATNFRTAHSEWMGPFKNIGFLSCGMDPRK